MAGRAGRGRARGRAKPPTQGVQEAPRAPTSAGPSSGPPKPAGPPPGMAAHKPVPAISGRAMHRGAGRSLDDAPAITQGVDTLSLGSGSGNGNSSGAGNGAPVGRGNMRGKRQIFVTVKTRPETLTSKKGTSGQPILLQANYFSLVHKDWWLYQYRVDFDPTIDHIGERKKLLRVQKKNIGGEYIFDGTMMFCSHLIKPDTIEVFSERESDSSQVRITIRLVGDLQLEDTHYMQFFNILTRKCLTFLDLQLINRDYFDPKAKMGVSEYYLELWPGYKTVINKHEQGVLMCAEITHKVMRTDNCNHLLSDIARRNPETYKDEFTKAVVGSVVLTDYNNKTYVISDVNWEESPNSTFDKNGTQVSYINYYKERYNITIKENRQPLLVSKTKPRDERAIKQEAVTQPGAQDPKMVLLIPELCRMTGLTAEMRNNFQLMRAMAAHTRIGPAERIKRLMTMNRRLNGEERVKKEFQNWDLKLAEKLVDIPARILPPEKIVFNGTEVTSGDECDWTRSLRSSSMFVSPEGGLSRWVILYPNKVSRDVEAFVDTLRNAAKGMKFLISQPQFVETGGDNIQFYLGKLDQAISSLNPQLVFVVLMSNRGDLYSAIKKRSLVDRAVPTQVLLAKNLNKKGVMSIATKVAIQMNCKIGGAPWSVYNPIGGLMVIGFDVCHDPASKAKSYGGMVASLNRSMTRYFSAVSHHKIGEELSNDLAMNITKALHSYRKHNNTLPSHIIIYRDGVGDGQIPTVLSHELVRIQQGLKEIYGQNPKLGFIIVSKRINTRIFAGNDNPKPGTVVDDVITLPLRYDFFIVSQFVNQGTVSPTSYNIIHDTLGLDPDKIQRLTFKMTHMYYNWSGTVRVPAPVQYAHKLAFLVSQSLHRPAHPSLDELLYFL